MGRLSFFEKASKTKLRFDTPRGQVNTEDLWDLPMSGNEGYSLDGIARNLNKTIKDNDEDESFVKPKVGVKPSVLLGFEVVKRVIEVRQQDLATKEKRAENARQRAIVLDVLAEKEDAALRGKSKKALKEMLDSFDEDDDED